MPAAAVRKPAPRGLRTLVPLENWRRDGWAFEAPPAGRTRPVQHPPAEMIVLTAVPDLVRFIVREETIAAAP